MLSRQSHKRVGSRTVARTVCAAAALAASATVPAKDYCAHNATELVSALADAGSGGSADAQDNTIRVAAGTFTTSGAPFTFGTLGGHALSIDGGWNGTCTIQDLTPGATKLDGAGLTQVLSLNTNGDISVAHLTIRNASYGGSAGAGAAIALNGVTADAIAIFDSNVVTGNVDTFGGGSGLSIYGNGTVFVENSVFAGNSGKSVAAFSVSLTVGTAYITNDTITGNTNTESGHQITTIGGAGAVGHVSNTISYGNHGITSDFYLYGYQTVDFVNDDYLAISGQPSPASSGNFIGVDPQFVAADDFHLRSTSPLLRAGTPTPAGGLPATDIEGHPRSFGGQVDLGAFESVDFIFANGLELP